jgi:hypothetical protein
LRQFSREQYQNKGREEEVSRKGPLTA